LTRCQEQAIAALLSRKTHTEAAAAVGISEATLQRWLRLPEFQAAYRAARRAVVESAVALLQNAASQAVEALVANLKAAKPADQIRAAVEILEYAMRGLDVLDLAARIEELERALGGEKDAEGESGGEAGEAGEPGPDPPPGGGAAPVDPAAGPADDGPGQPG
jgi:hypothetical protein